MIYEIMTLTDFTNEWIECIMCDVPLLHQMAAQMRYHDNLSIPEWPYAMEDD